MYHWSLSLAKGCHLHPASLPRDMSETNLVSHKGRSLGISKFPTQTLGWRKGKGKGSMAPLGVRDLRMEVLLLVSQ